MSELSRIGSYSEKPGQPELLTDHLVSPSLASGKRSDVGQEIHLSRGAANCSYGQKDRGLAQST